MTPDLTARIEELARETATGINQWHDTESMKTHCIELDTVVLRDVLSTFAASIIAEKDAAAAAMRDALTKCQVAFGDETIVNGPKNGQGTYYAIGVAASVELALSSTAGRDTLAELVSLRERVRELEGALTWYECPDHPIGSLAEMDHKFRDKIKQLSLTTTEPRA